MFDYLYYIMYISLVAIGEEMSLSKQENKDDELFSAFKMLADEAQKKQNSKKILSHLLESMTLMNGNVLTKVLTYFEETNSELLSEKILLDNSSEGMSKKHRILLSLLNQSFNKLSTEAKEIISDEWNKFNIGYKVKIIARSARENKEFIDFVSSCVDKDDNLQVQTTQKFANELNYVWETWEIYLPQKTAQEKNSLSNLLCAFAKKNHGCLNHGFSSKAKEKKSFDSPFFNVIKNGSQFFTDKNLLDILDSFAIHPILLLSFREAGGIKDNGFGLEWNKNVFNKAMANGSGWALDSLLADNPLQAVNNQYLHQRKLVFDKYILGPFSPSLVNKLRHNKQLSFNLEDVAANPLLTDDKKEDLQKSIKGVLLLLQQPPEAIQKIWEFNELQNEDSKKKVLFGKSMSEFLTLAKKILNDNEPIFEKNDFLYFVHDNVQSTIDYSFKLNENTWFESKSNLESLILSYSVPFSSNNIGNKFKI